MSDVKKARKLFRKGKIGFPRIPRELASQLEEQSEWLFSSREIDHPFSPYWLRDYLTDFQEGEREDFVLIGQAGHGVNSYAILYYLVHGPLAIFLKMPWGGIYMDNKECAAEIRKIFSLLDKISRAREYLESRGTQLLIVGDRFEWQCFWEFSKVDSDSRERHEATDSRTGPGLIELLNEVIDWLPEEVVKRDSFLKRFWEGLRFWC